MNKANTVSPRLAIVSGECPEVRAALSDCGLEVIEVIPYGNNRENPEAVHADMQVLRIGQKIVLLKDNDELNNRIIDRIRDNTYEIFYTDSKIENFVYPECVKLNIALVGKNAIGNFRYADSAVSNILSRSEYTAINVKQGYAKCSTAVVEDNAVITSDSSVYKSAIENGIDCLKISQGHIELCERYGGFIGGACFLLDKSTLAFTGDITDHPDYINIKGFCLNYGVRLFSLVHAPLLDVGGVVLL